MNSIKQIFFISICFLVLASCAKFEVKEVNKDLRIISYTYADSKIRVINQKFNSKQNAWYEAKCLVNEIEYYFLNCTKKNITFTKKSLTIIRSLEANKNDNNQILLVAKISEESSSEEESSSGEESSSEEEAEFEEPFDPAPPPGECVGGPDFC